jgi:mono/diheme cytochrome c family protein
VSRFTRGLLVALLAVVLAALGATALVVTRGISARERPGRLEMFVARRVRHLAIPSRARALANPVPATAENVAAGLGHFADHCAVCHSNDGGGDTAFGRNLYPKPPDLRRPDTQSLSDGELFYIIENGVRFTGMPAFGDGTAASAEDSWRLVRFIRHLPQVTPDELAEMRRLNPKTPEQLRQEEEIRRFLGEEDTTPAPGRTRPR